MYSVTYKKRSVTQEDKIIGNNLKKIRLAMNMSQTGLGELSDVTFQQIQKYEKGTNRIAASKLVKISNALGVDVKIFLGDLIENDDPQFNIHGLDKQKLSLMMLLSKVDNENTIQSLINILSYSDKNT